jgi:hypothetical protein
MEVLTIECEAFNSIVARIENIEKLIVEKKQPALFNNVDFIQMMGISKRTAQDWRDKGIIGFSQVSGKIYYRWEDIQEFLKRHYNRPFKNITGKPFEFIP